MWAEAQEITVEEVAPAGLGEKVLESADGEQHG
jgi:hypothetical protein